MNLRDSARGEICTVQIAGVCNGNVETTVLAHLRFAGFGGMGKKPDDLIALYACSACHDRLDGRTGPFLDRDDWHFYALRGLARTHVRMVETGVLTAKGRKAA